MSSAKLLTTFIILLASVHFTLSSDGSSVQGTDSQSNATSTQESVTTDKDTSPDGIVGTTVGSKTSSDTPNDQSSNPSSAAASTIASETTDKDTSPDGSASSGPTTGSETSAISTSPDTLNDQSSNPPSAAASTLESETTDGSTSDNGQTANSTPGVSDGATSDGVTDESKAATTKAGSPTSSDQCHNSSDCQDHASCLNTTGTFRCACDQGFQGNDTFCSDIDECETADKYDCPDNSTCMNMPGNYSCPCDTGFSKNGSICQDIDECETADKYDCPDNSTCMNMPGNYSCPCDTGFSKNGSICQDIDECETADKYDCPDNSTCMNMPGNYSCLCDAGFSKNGTICEDIDECETADKYDCPDNSTCMNMPGNYSCLCDAGFSKNGTICEDIDECETADKYDCPDNSTCMNMPGNYSCPCDTGFSKNGTICQDFDECETVENHNCPDNSTCKNIPGNYTCPCDAGFSKNGSICQDIDECETDKYDCPDNSTCKNMPGNYTCPCDAGFSKNDSICQDIDECLTDSPCDAHANCNNSIGSHVCTCHEGFDGDGIICKDINECKSNSACPEHSTCLNSIGSYSCPCKEGFTKNGSLCQDVNECVDSSDGHPCDKNANCTNSVGSYDCKCHPGYEGNGKQCEVTPICEEAKCENNGLCIQKVASVYYCLCTDSWKGDRCEKDIDECAKGTDNCPENSTCTNGNGTFKCDCNDRFELVGGLCREQFMFRLSGEHPFGKVHQENNIDLAFPYSYLDGEIFRNIYAYTNGYVSFGREFKQNMPPDVSHWPSYPPIVAVHWTNMEFGNATGGLYVYQENRANNLSADTFLLQRVEELASTKNFKPLAAIAITWLDAHPYPRSQFPEDKLRAQIIVASDGSFTYIIRNYDVTWSDKDKNRRPRVSFAYTDASQKGKEDSPIKGGGPGGQNIITPQEPVNDKTYQCYENINKPTKSIPQLDACPCRKDQAERDPGFEKDLSDSFNYTSLFWSEGWKQTCYYDRFGLLKKNMGFPQAKNQDLSLNNAHTSCCSDNIPLRCSAFYNAFPSDDCSDYKDNTGGGGGGFGDPHIINFDGDKFTFNMEGDFTLFQYGDIELQGRTTKSAFNTTFFSAFALKVKKDSSPYVVNKDGTINWTKDEDGVRADETMKSITFQTPDGVASVKFKNDNDVWTFEVNGIGKATKGIMGNNNKKTEDDFRDLKGPAKKLSGDEIQTFAQKWAVEDKKESLFGELTTAKRLSDPPNPVAAIIEAIKKKYQGNSDWEKTCQSDLFCLQDFYATENLQSAEKTKTKSEKLQKDTEDLPTPLKFGNEEKLQWFLVNNTLTLKLDVPDVENFVLTETIPELKLDKGILTLDLKANLDTLRTTDYPQMLTVVAKAEGRPSQQYKPRVELCLCDTRDECTEKTVTDLLGVAEGNVLNMECNCGTGKQGKYCEKEVDKCQSCFRTDLCNSSLPDPCLCPEGYKKEDKGICREVDECSDGNNGGCQQLCRDLINTTECSCLRGFEKDGPTCKDIEECATLPCRSDQQCEEVQGGGHVCHCYSGYGGDECIKAPFKYPGSFNLLRVDWKEEYSNGYSSLHGNLSRALQSKFESEMKWNDTFYVDIVDIYKLNEPKKNDTGVRRKRNTDTNLPNTDGIEVIFLINTDKDVLNNIKNLFQKCIKNSACQIGDYNIKSLILKDESYLCELPTSQSTCDKISTTCAVKDHQFVCNCRDGYEAGSSPLVCIDVNECQDLKYCGKYQCVNVKGSFSCNCPDGFMTNHTSKKCQAKPNPCAQSPCKNDGICFNSNGTARCICTYGWEGKYCSEEENKARQSEVAIIAVSSVLGALCLILIIAIIVLCCRMRRKNVENSTWTHSDYATSQRIPRPKVSSSKSGNGSNATYDTLTSDNMSGTNHYTAPDYDDSTPHVYHNKAYETGDKL